MNVFAALIRLRSYNNNYFDVTIIYTKECQQFVATMSVKDFKIIYYIVEIFCKCKAQIYKIFCKCYAQIRKLFYKCYAQIRKIFDEYNVKLHTSSAYKLKVMKIIK